MRSIIIGSSMSMPTLELKYEDTILYKVKKFFPDVEFIDKCQRSSSTDRLVKEGQNGNGSDLLEAYSPDFVIIHIGITDASPRLLKRRSIYTLLLNRSPFSKFIYNLVRKFKGRTISSADLTTEKFYDNISKYAERANNNNVPVFCVKMLHCGVKVIKKSPHMNESLDLYNKLFDKLENQYSNVHLITPMVGINDEDLVRYMQSDQIHLNPKGCDIVANEISTIVRKYMKI